MLQHLKIHISTKLLLTCVLVGLALALVIIFNAEPAVLEDLPLRRF
jgi:hypothetical protein